MDVVLGVSLPRPAAPLTVRMVLMAGENADGATVDDDAFEVAGQDSVPDRVVAAILGTRESAREGGYQLTSTGVTCGDEPEAVALRAVLAERKIENVMLVSAFLAAAALAQAVGSLTRYARTGLLFIEPETATLAVVDSADGSIAEVHRRSLSADDDRAVAELVELVAGVDRLASHPDGVFVVGSGVDVAMIKPELEKVSPLPVSAPEEPETALARGAALASAHAPLFFSSTQALAWAQDPGTGAVDPALLGLVDCQPDCSATPDCRPLAYSAVRDAGHQSSPGADSRLLDFGVAADHHQRTPFLVTGSALAALFVIGVVTLVIALAVGMRPTGDHRPGVRANVVTPVQQAPAPPPSVKAPAPQQAPQSVPPEAPAPAPEAPGSTPEAPAPAPEAPGSTPEAPAPAPEPVAPALPPIIPQILIPGLPGGPPIFGPRVPGDWDHGDHWGGGEGRDRGGGHGGGILIPIPGLGFPTTKR